MKIAITIVALAEICVLLASVVALLWLALRKIVRMVRGDEERRAPSYRALASLSGTEPVKTWLGQLGMHVSDAEAHEITAAVRAHSLKTKSIPSHAELRALAQDVINRAA